LCNAANILSHIGASSTISDVQNYVLKKCRRQRPEIWKRQQLKFIFDSEEIWKRQQLKFIFDSELRTAIILLKIDCHDQFKSTGLVISTGFGKY